MKDDFILQVAQIGKTVGLKGELKLHNKSDFPEQFKQGSNFLTSQKVKLTIQNYNQKRSLVKFVGYDNKDDASSLTNQFIFTDLKSTLKQCTLKKDEFFWFDVIGSKIIENNNILGEVISIERFEPNDYLLVKTDKSMSSLGHAIKFLIPYIDRYIINFDKQERKIFTKDCIGILENS